MQALQQCEPNWDVYWKNGGFSKYWDNYNTERIVVVDDPSPPDAQKDRETAQRFKTAISTGPAYQEVKFGTMVYDPYLVVIISNFDPVSMDQMMKWLFTGDSLTHVEVSKLILLLKPS